MTKEELKDRIERAEEIQLYTENRCEALEKENAELKKEIAELKEDKIFLNNLVKEKEQRGLEVQQDLLKEKSEAVENEVRQLREQNSYMFDTIALKSQQIGKLEKENERLRGDLELWESGGCRATNLFKCGVVQELKQQIEKMKCPWNCRKFGHCKYTNCPCDKWEIEK